MGKDSKERGHKASLERLKKKHHKGDKDSKTKRRSHKKDKKKHREYKFFIADNHSFDKFIFYYARQQIAEAPDTNP